MTTIDPQELVKVRFQAKSVLGSGGLDMDASNALEALISAVDGVLAQTSSGRMPTTPQPVKPQPVTDIGKIGQLEQRIALLERQAAYGEAPITSAS